MFQFDSENGFVIATSYGSCAEDLQELHLCLHFNKL